MWASVIRKNKRTKNRCEYLFSKYLIENWTNKFGLFFYLTDAFGRIMQLSYMSTMWFKLFIIAFIMGLSVINTYCKSPKSINSLKRRSLKTTQQVMKRLHWLESWFSFQSTKETMSSGTLYCVCTTNKKTQHFFHYKFLTDFTGEEIIPSDRHEDLHCRRHWVLFVLEVTKWWKMEAWWWLGWWHTIPAPTAKWTIT